MNFILIIISFSKAQEIGIPLVLRVKIRGGGVDTEEGETLLCIHEEKTYNLGSAVR
jgi:hypothetical protein